MKTLAWLVIVVSLAAPAAAQTAQDTPPLSIRPFVLGTVQSFTAADTFDAVFGSTTEPFVGGGVQVLVKGTYFVDLTASRFKKTGQRAFISNGQDFQLGIPLTATLVPFEVTGGYRYNLSPRIKPYVSAGFGSYHYEETSQFSDAGENIDTRHGGFVLNGGAEFRLHRWVGLALDVQYTHVPGILGTGGVSHQANENDLGGVAGRLKVVVGR
jgi:opacity protein-like surface antigen